MKKMGFPPLVGSITNGLVTWQRLDSLDYELIGYFLSCHLVIEHYLDEYLKTRYPGLGWEASRQTFGQKVALLATDDYPEQYNSIPAIKHLNSLRNSLSHDIEFSISSANMMPFVDYLRKSCESKVTIPDDPKEILDFFTSMVCVWFASGISSTARHYKRTK